MQISHHVNFTGVHNITSELHKNECVCVINSLVATVCNFFFFFSKLIKQQPKLTITNNKQN